MSTRRRVLEQLEGSGGQSVSGEELARRLGLTRTAVWKAVGELKKDGYLIEAVRNKGYRLLPQAEKLSPRALLPHLPADFAPGLLHHYGVLTSTSQAAKELALKGAPHGAVVIADAQTAGRGRRWRSFFSPPGGIYMSFVLRPSKLPLERATLVATAAAVAVRRALRQVTGQEVRVKWVNDVFLDDKKICGILTEAEAEVESGLVEAIVLGLGLNFNALPASFPEDLAGKAGAVCPGSNDGALKARLAAALITAVLEAEREPADPGLLEEYRQCSLMPGRRVAIRQGGGITVAIAEDIDDMGRLVVRLPDGSRRSLRAGESEVELLLST